jgi:outer membrane protein assembly factor BamB
MKNRTVRTGVLALLALAVIGVHAEDWPRFRGPNGSGVAKATGLPVEFGPGKNLAWRVAAPFGRSSPIVVGDRVFLTASEGGQLLTLGYDLASGRELWRRSVAPAHRHEIYKANDAASPTAASDGNHLYVFFADFGLLSYTLDGKERWRYRMGPFTNFYGIGSSPIVEKGLVIMVCDQIRGSYAVAVDAGTGKERWRRERPETPDGWGVPVVRGDELVAVGSTRVDGYQLATGEPRWWMPLSSNGSMGSPVFHGETLLVAASGSEEPWLPGFAAVVAKSDRNGDGMVSREEVKEEKDWVEHFGWVDADRDGLLNAREWEAARQFGVGNYGAVAIPLGGKGKIEGTAVKWRMKRNLPYIPSPVLYDGVYYMVKTGGIVTSMNPETGEIWKQGRATGALGTYNASPVAADGKIYAANEEGKVAVLRAGAQWEVLAVNDLGDEIFATPALSGGRVVVRTRRALWSFGGK